MPATDEELVGEWLHDAFAILSRRKPGATPAETNLHRALEAVVRHLPSSRCDLQMFRVAAGAHVDELSNDDLRNILQALDSCLALFARNERGLTIGQRFTYILVRASRRNADEALQARRTQSSIPHWMGQSAARPPSARGQAVHKALTLA